MSLGDDMCNFATFRPATLTVTNFFKQVRLCLGVILIIMSGFFFRLFVCFGALEFGVVFLYCYSNMTMMCYVNHQLFYYWSCYGKKQRINWYQIIWWEIKLRFEFWVTSYETKGTEKSAKVKMLQNYCQLTWGHNWPPHLLNDLWIRDGFFEGGWTQIIRDRTG